MVGKYKVITLCGSTKFKDDFFKEQKRLTLEGNIVILVGMFRHSGDNEVFQEYVKTMLDDMHKRKIAMAQKLCKELSIGVGISSGANVLGGVLAKGDSVVVLPDDNKKYLSTDLSKDVNSVLVDNIKLISLSVI